MPPPDEDSLFGIIDHAYRAAMTPGSWPEFVSSLGSVFESPVSGMFICDFSDGSSPLATSDAWLAVMDGLADDHSASYQAHYSAVNPWLRDPGQLPLSRAVTSGMLFPDCELERTEFHADWLRPQNLHYSMGAIIGLRGSRGLSMTFMRSRRAGAFDRNELSAWQRLVPHLQRAVELHSRLAVAEQRSADLLNALNMLSTGVITLDERLRIVTVNQAASRLLSESRGLSIDREHRLTATPLSAAQELEQECRDALTSLLAAAASPLQAGVVSTAGASGELQLCVSRLAERAESRGRARLVVFVGPPGALPSDLQALLKRVYALTKAEARLAEDLCSGRSLNEIAELRQLSVHTVRAQLRALTGKVGVRRQADLVRVLLTGPVATLRMIAKAGGDANG